MPNISAQSNKSLMMMLHNISANTDPRRFEKAAERKRAIFREWVRRTRQFMCGDSVDVMEEQGVLSAFGYRVGESGLSSDSKRRRILELIFEAPIPPILNPDYVREWGCPQSAQRKQKMGNVLRGLAHTSRVNNIGSSHALALRHYETDLAVVATLTAT